MLSWIAFYLEKVARHKSSDSASVEYSFSVLLDFHKQLSSIYNKTESLQNTRLGIRLLRVRTPLDWIALRSNLFQVIAVEQCEANARQYVDRLDSCLKYNVKQMNIESLHFD
ncbi:MAG: hypothetical protein HC858_07935 [Brachymonas sp.]|nr:hypothetical protein [Brachymonas sp.]NJS35489.1 hypothetical protein [Brachymonas sp.]